MKNYTIKELVLMGLFAAILCVLAPFSIPIGEVPISITNFIIYLSIYILGWKKSTTSYIIYLLLGLIGLPVFSGFTGGLGKIIGPTGGYLIGFIFTAIISGIIIEKYDYKKGFSILGMLLGLIITYTFGTIWLAFGLGRTFVEALAIGVLPFLIFDIIKIVLASIIGPQARKLIQKAIQ